MSSPRKPAFTLVEILIVVVLLGILAAIVIPQFTLATETAARETALNELQKLRRHIEVFRARNSGALPNVQAGNGTWGELVGGVEPQLHAPPVNPWTGGINSRLIIFGAAADAGYHQNYGWVFNPVDGMVWAAGFDANDEPHPRN